MPVIRGAQKWQRRPSAAIMGDDWFGHRDPLTGKPSGDKDEYTNWDYALMNAFQTIEDYTDQKSGVPAWELEDEDAYVDANKKHNRFQAAIDRKTRGTDKKPYKPDPGEYFVPRVRSHNLDENGNEVFQTFREWVNKTVERERD